LVFSPQEKLQFINPHARTFFGVREEDKLGKLNLKSIFLNENFYRDFVSQINASVEKGEKVDNLQTNFTNNAQKSVPVLSSVIPFKLENQNKPSVLILARDITDRVKIEVGLQQKTEELEKMNKLMIGRELKMIELKEKLEEYEKSHGEK